MLVISVQRESQLPEGSAVLKYGLDENLLGMNGGFCCQMENCLRWAVRTHHILNYFPGNKGERKKPDSQYRMRKESYSWERGQWGSKLSLPSIRVLHLWCFLCQKHLRKCLLLFHKRSFCKTLGIFGMVTETEQFSLCNRPLAGDIE